MGREVGVDPLLLRLAAPVTFLAIVGCSSTPSTPRQTDLISVNLLLGVDGGKEQSMFVETRIAQCMSDSGFRYVPRIEEPRDEDMPGTVAYAAKHGYGIGPSSEVEQPLEHDQNSDQLAAMTDAEREAFIADRDQCQGEALEALEARQQELTVGLGDEGVALLQSAIDGSSPAFEEAIARWRQCLERKGFAGFPSSASIRQQFDTEWTAIENGQPDEGFLDRQRAAAVADAQCQATEVAAARLDVLQELEYRLRGGPPAGT